MFDPKLTLSHESKLIVSRARVDNLIPSILDREGPRLCLGGLCRDISKMSVIANNEVDSHKKPSGGGDRSNHKGGVDVLWFNKKEHFSLAGCPISSGTL